MVAAPMMTWQASKGSPVGKARVRCLKHCSSCHDKQAQSTANQLTHVQVHGVEGKGVQWALPGVGGRGFADQGRPRHRRAALAV